MWLLLVEDERSLAQTVQAGLAEQGFKVDWAADGLEGQRLALERGYDLLIVDWRLPEQDGRTLVEHVREEGLETPILMLTVMSEVQRRVEGLEAGADDYLPKPFEFEELVARIRALARRPSLGATQKPVEAGPLRVRPAQREAFLEGTRIPLRPKEAGILSLLAKCSGNTVSRTKIAEQVWGRAAGVSANTIQVTVSTLREKLAGASGPDADLSIRSEKGRGYRLEIGSASRAR